MIANASQGSWRIRFLGVATAAVVLTALTAAAPVTARPTAGDCLPEQDFGDVTSAACLTEEQIAAMDDTDAAPAADEISHSSNLRLVANYPKQPPFDAINSLNSDIAFQGKYAYAGNYNGFVIFDVHNPRKPELVSQVLCPGSQNDISVYGNLLFLSTDSSRSNDSCASTAQSATIKESWEGIKIFDVSDKANPRYLKSVETKCGSHTHTLLPDRGNVYVYISSYSPNVNFPDCNPPHDLISIVKVPLGDPGAAAVVATPNLFPDTTGGERTSGCHDITVFPSKRIAAGACMGDGILMDISDPEAPRVINRVRDTVNFSFWHSATFSQSGDKVVFTDELGGGTGPTCNTTVDPNRGADAFYDIVGEGDARTMVFRSYFKIPRVNANTENCVAHNGSIVPTLRGDYLVQAWYQGGISVIDFTDSSNVVEIAYWDRGSFSNTLVTAGSWSAYWYNGHIFSNDIQKGLDVLELCDLRTITANFHRTHELNVQTQPTYWPFRR